jgi:hypothetical protein
MSKKPRKPYLTDSAVAAGIGDALCSDAKGTSAAGRPDPYHGVAMVAGGQRAAAPLGRTPDTIPLQKLRVQESADLGSETYVVPATVARGYPTDEAVAAARAANWPECRVCAGLEAEVRVAGQVVRALMVSLAAGYTGMSVEDLKQWEVDTAAIRETLAKARAKRDVHRRERGHR